MPACTGTAAVKVDHTVDSIRFEHPSIGEVTVRQDLEFRMLLMLLPLKLLLQQLQLLLLQLQLLLLLLQLLLLLMQQLLLLT